MVFILLRILELLASFWMIRCLIASTFSNDDPSVPLKLSLSLATCILVCKIVSDGVVCSVWRGGDDSQLCHYTARETAREKAVY